MNRSYRPWLMLCLIAISLAVAACAAPAPAPTDTPSAPSAPVEPAATPAVAPPPTTLPAAAPTSELTNTVQIPLTQGGGAAATPSSQAGAARLEGTIQYSAGAAPDPDSLIEVQLLDMTSFDVVATQTIEMPAPEPKVPFAVDYDPAKIDPQRKYGLVALVTVGPDVKWATGDPLPVLAAGQPAAGLVLTVNAVPVAAAAPPAAATAPAAQPTPVPTLATAANNTVNGSLTYSGGTLDPNAVIEVELRDVSLPNGPGQIVAAQTINAAGQQAPIPFAIPYDPARIDQSHYYLVFARVTVNGQLSWFSSGAVYVISFGNPTNVEVLLEPIKP